MPKAQAQAGIKLNEEQDLQSAVLIGHVQKQCAIVNIFGVNILEKQEKPARSALECAWCSHGTV